MDKMPENTFNLGWITTVFPHAKLIHRAGATLHGTSHYRAG